MKASKLVILLALVSTTFLVACGKKESSTTRIRGGNGVNGQGFGVNGQGVYQGVGCEAYVMPSNNSFSSSYNNSGFNSFSGNNYGLDNFNNTGGASDPFTNVIKDFLSFAVYPNEVGTVSNQGVKLGLGFAKDPSGNIGMQGSQLSITVTDSFVGQMMQSGQVASPMSVTYDNKASGKVDPMSRTFNIVFDGANSAITLSGNFQQGSANGRISFVNKTSVDGGYPKSGEMGNFSMTGCALFN